MEEEEDGIRGGNKEGGRDIRKEGEKKGSVM